MRTIVCSTKDMTKVLSKDLFVLIGGSFEVDVLTPVSMTPFKGFKGPTRSGHIPRIISNVDTNLLELPLFKLWA